MGRLDRFDVKYSENRKQWNIRFVEVQEEKVKSFSAYVKYDSESRSISMSVRHMYTQAIFSLAQDKYSAPVGIPPVPPSS